MLRLLDEKKGIMATNMLAFIPRMIFLTFAFFACFFLLRMFVNQTFNTQAIQAELLVQGLLYGPGGVSYTDPLTGRIIPEFIDPTQWNESTLNIGFNFPKNNLITARITLSKSKNLEIRGLARKKGYREDLDGYDPVATVYYNKDWWDNWQPLARSKIRGLGSIDTDVTEVPVIYFDDKKELHSGFLQIVILQPN